VRPWQPSTHRTDAPDSVDGYGNWHVLDDSEELEFHAFVDT
jgi:hypothetical protein